MPALGFVRQQFVLAASVGDALPTLFGFCRYAQLIGGNTLPEINEKTYGTLQMTISSQQHKETQKNRNLRDSTQSRTCRLQLCEHTAQGYAFAYHAKTPDPEWEI